MLHSEYLTQHSAICVDIACASSRSEAMTAEARLAALEAAYRFITQQGIAEPVPKNEARRYNAVTAMIRKALWGAE